MTTPTQGIAVDVRPVAGHIGAEVFGVDLRSELDEETVRSIKAALYEWGVLFFPKTGMGPADHVRFAKHFGQVEMPHDRLVSLKDDGFPEVSVIATVKNKPVRSAKSKGKYIGADHWHSDVTWKDAPSRYSILHMQVLPPAGGDTMWLSQSAAFEALATPVQDMLTGLTAYHRLPVMDDEIGCDHPVVIQHPDTGRRALFVNALFTQRINELPEVQSRGLLDMLNAHSTQPEFTCRRRWSEGDLAIWDNHFVQHYAVADYGTQDRKIHRIEAAGEKPIAG